MSVAPGMEKFEKPWISIFYSTSEIRIGYVQKPVNIHNSGTFRVYLALMGKSSSGLLNSMSVIWLWILCSLIQSWRVGVDINIWSTASGPPAFFSVTLISQRWHQNRLLIMKCCFQRGFIDNTSQVESVLKGRSSELPLAIKHPRIYEYWHD
jgi:hypothetical protein